MKHMDLDTFTFMVNTITDLLDESRDFDNKMSKAFGGDTRIITELNHKIIENIESYLKDHFNDEDCWIEYLIWEVNTSSRPLTIQINDIDYIANTEIIYKLITGELV